MFCSPSAQAPMPPGTHNIVPARRLCKQYKLFRPPQSATTRRLALRPVPILHAGKRHTVKPPLRTPSFLPFFGKKGRPARRGQRPPPPSGGVSPSCRRSGKIAFGNFIWGITSFLPAFDAKSGRKSARAVALDPESCRSCHEGLKRLPLYPNTPVCTSTIYSTVPPKMEISVFFFHACSAITTPTQMSCGSQLPAAAKLRFRRQ